VTSESVGGTHMTTPDLPSSRLRQASPRDVHVRCFKYIALVVLFMAKQTPNLPSSRLRQASPEVGHVRGVEYLK